MKNNETEKKLEIPLSLHQSLEFKDICPVWSSKLKFGLDKQDVKILAHDSKYCIVGEAWGYTGRQAGYYMAPLISLVGCWECVKLGREMGKIAKEFGTLAAPDHLQPTICYFVKHWNLKHSPVSERSTYDKIWKNLRFKLHFNGQKEAKPN